MRRGETQPQSETLRRKRSFNKTNTNVLREQKAERKSRAPKQCSSPKESGGETKSAQRKQGDDLVRRRLRDSENLKPNTWENVLWHQETLQE